jgi:dolichol-phosphate mannosyltransferase
MINVLLPCYNEELNLKELVAKISEVCKDFDYRIVAVDDGSIDGTYPLLCSLSEDFPLVVLKHEKNKGLHEALKTLIFWIHDNAEDFDYVITMDSDLTHDPKYIPSLVSYCEKNDAQVAIASRYADGGVQLGVSAYRVLLSKCLRIFAKIELMLPVKDVSSGYRCIQASSIKKLVKIYGSRNLIMARGFDVQLELLYKLHLCGAKISEMPFTLDYSLKRGKSKLKVRRTIFGYFNTVSRLKHLQSNNMYWKSSR